MGCAKKKITAQQKCDDGASVFVLFGPGDKEKTYVTERGTLLFVSCGYGCGRGCGRCCVSRLDWKARTNASTRMEDERVQIDTKYGIAAVTVAALGKPRRWGSLFFSGRSFFPWRGRECCSLLDARRDSPRREYAGRTVLAQRRNDNWDKRSFLVIFFTLLYFRPFVLILSLSTKVGFDAVYQGVILPSPVGQTKHCCSTLISSSPPNTTLYLTSKKWLTQNDESEHGDDSRCKCKVQGPCNCILVRSTGDESCQ